MAIFLRNGRSCYFACSCHTPLSPSLSLSLCLSLCLCVSVSVSLSLSLSVCLCLSLSLSLPAPSHSFFFPRSLSARLTSSLLTAANKSVVSGAVFLDLRKASDLVGHDSLLTKLTIYFKKKGMFSTVFCKSDLHNRTQSVLLHDHYSSEDSLCRRAHTHARTDARTHTHTRARMHTHIHTHTCRPRRCPRETMPQSI